MALFFLQRARFLYATVVTIEYGKWSPFFEFIKPASTSSYTESKFYKLMNQAVKKKFSI